jgi:hypothetical protein
MIRLLAFLLVLLTACPSWAVITYDHGTASTDTASVTSVTTSFTVASCTNCILLACVATSGTVGTDSTSMTFNTSENFTSARAGQLGTWSGTIESYTHFWYLVNPTITTADVVTNWGGGTGSTDRGAKVFTMLFQGVDQVSPIDSSNSQASSSSSTSTSTTTVAVNAWIADCVIGDTTMTVGGGTARLNNDANQTDFIGVSTVADKATPGAQAMDWNITADDWVSTVVSLKPFVAAGSCTGGMMLLGVGGC